MLQEEYPLFLNCHSSTLFFILANWIQATNPLVIPSGRHFRAFTLQSLQTFPSRSVNSGRMQSAPNILACGFLIGILLKSSMCDYRCWHSEGSAIILIISNTALIQRIHHGHASQMKPVIYHHVGCLKHSFLKCGLKMQNERGTYLWSILDGVF